MTVKVKGGENACVREKNNKPMKKERESDAYSSSARETGGIFFNKLVTVCIIDSKSRIINC
jgi:hypothetical protein